MSIKKTTTTRQEGNKKITTIVEEEVIAGAKSLSDDVKEQIKKLRAAGATLREVAKKFGVSPSTVHRHQTVTQAVASAIGTNTPTAPRKKNHITLILDDSISMGQCFREAVAQINNTITKIKDEARTKDQDATVTVYLFSSTVRCLMYRVPAADAQPLVGLSAYGGSTALLDGVCMAIDRQILNDSGDPDTSYLFITATDGEENDSRSCTKQRMERMIVDTQARGNFTHAFITPDRNGVRYLTQLGVPPDNITIWAATVEGAKEVFAQTNASLDSYFTERGTGTKSTTKFYATADASKLTKAELQNKLVDDRGLYKRVEVPKEMSISDFCQHVLGKPWISGACYYQLSKKETVHESKDVLIMEKGAKAIWGGNDARELVGLPPKGTKVVVTPGNLGNYDLYVKSTSFNRVLVRGTYVLVDKDKLASGVGDPETWDRVAAEAAANAKKANTPTV